MKCVLALVMCLLGTVAYSQYEGIEPQGIYTSEFNIDEIPRKITYYMPLGYGKKVTYPLLIVLHDSGSTAAATIKKLGDDLHAHADSAGCIVLYPDAVNGRWHSSATSTTPSRDSINDAGFIGIMTDFFIQQFQSNSDELFVLGIGTGGSLAWNIHCNRPGTYAAVVAVQAPLNLACNSSTPALEVNNTGNNKEAISRAWQFINQYIKNKE